MPGAIPRPPRHLHELQLRIPLKTARNPHLRKDRRYGESEHPLSEPMAQACPQVPPAWALGAPSTICYSGTGVGAECPDEMQTYNNTRRPVSMTITGARTIITDNTSSVQERVHATAVLISSQESTLQDLIACLRCGRLPAEIAATALHLRTKRPVREDAIERVITDPDDWAKYIAEAQ
jgi:hypothetical protein